MSLADYHGLDGHDSVGLFQHIMAVIQSHPPIKERCKAAQKSCDILEQQVKDMAAKTGIDYNKVKTDAEALKAMERGGDILLALNNLSDFTGPNDPRGTELASERRSKYLSGVQYFVAVAREYLESRIETADYFAAHPEELRP